MTVSNYSLLWFCRNAEGCRKTERLISASECGTQMMIVMGMKNTKALETTRKHGGNNRSDASLNDS